MLLRWSITSRLAQERIAVLVLDASGIVNILHTDPLSRFSDEPTILGNQSSFNGGSSCSAKSAFVVDVDISTLFSPFPFPTPQPTIWWHTASRLSDRPEALFVPIFLVIRHHSPGGECVSGWSMDLIYLLVTQNRCKS